MVELRRRVGVAAAVALLGLIGSVVAAPWSAAAPGDADDDGVPDASDVCPAVADPNQLDADLDGIGDECDLLNEYTHLVFISSGPDTKIGDGVSRAWYGEDGAFSELHSVSDPGYGGIQYDSGPDSDDTDWKLEFEAPGAEALAVGLYEDAGEVADATHARMTITGSGQSCSSVDASFQVIELVRGGSNVITKLAVDFELACDGTPPLFGSLRYKANPHPDPVLAGRLSGDDRIETALAASQDTYLREGATRKDVKTQAVVLARSDGFADALAGTPLAHAVDGPLLLTGTAELDDRARFEIDRILDPGMTVYLLGGTAALSSAIESELDGAGYDVQRVAGADRYATAVAVAQKLGSPRTILLATGQNFPDGLSAGAAAARLDSAVLLTDGATMPAATAAYLSAHPSLPLFAIGGPAASAKPSAYPLVGADRYETAVKVAQFLFVGVVPVAGIASGENFPDALSGGANIARYEGPLLLTRRTTMPQVVIDHLRARVSFALQIYGGPAAIDDAVFDSLFGTASIGTASISKG